MYTHIHSYTHTGALINFHNLSKEEALYRLKNYYKFAIFRNPLERLLMSAYRNKLEPPLNYAIRRNFPDRYESVHLEEVSKRRL